MYKAMMTKLAKNKEKQMKNTIIIAVIVVLAAFWIAGPASLRAQGIITLEGYPHAVGICGEAKDEFVIHTIPEGSIIQHKGYFLTINKGHENDKEINNLRAAALIKCN